MKVTIEHNWGRAFASTFRPLVTSNSCCKTQIHQIIPPKPSGQAEAFWVLSALINEIPPAAAISNLQKSKVIFRKEHEGPWSLNKIKAWQLISSTEVNIVEVWCTAQGAWGLWLRQATVSCIFQRLDSGQYQKAQSITVCDVNLTECH